MNERPDPAVILDHIEAFRRSKTMFTAVRLGIFDALAEGPQSAAELALRLHLHPGAAERLLNAAVALGLLERAESVYRNTPAAAHYLVTASPRSFAGYVKYSDESLYLLWSHLDDAIREGTNRWQQTFGSRDALFDYYFRDPAATRAFISAMNGFGQLVSPRLVRGFDLRPFQHLVDLGGATGHLAIAACEAFSHLHATVLDLPRIAGLAEEHIRQSAVSDRVQFIAGDFFRDELPRGDLYALGRILHDWTDEKIVRLLEKVFSALPSGGGLLITEALVDEDCSGPRGALMQDLNMLVCTEGRERTFSEYRGLLEAAGFVSAYSEKTGSLVDGILARKA